jgi:hypothetical protein
MQEMMKVARKYTKLPGPEALEVAEACLDVLQAWGEAFLPRQRQFPNIVKAYQDLRKEGLPFRVQYDPSRVPIFTPSGLSNPSDSDTDAILAAAIASAALRDDEPSAAGRGSGSGSGGANGGQLVFGASKSFEPLCTAVSLLREMLLFCSDRSEVRNHELVPELLAQVETLQPALAADIERALTKGGEDVELLFKLNDDAQLVLSVTKELIALTSDITMEAAAVQLAGLSALCGGGEKAGEQTSTIADRGSAGRGLLDFGDVSSGADIVIKQSAAAPLKPISANIPPPPTTRAADPFGSSFLSSSPSPGPAPVKTIPLPPQSSVSSSSSSSSRGAGRAPSAADPFEDPFGKSPSIDDILLNGPAPTSFSFSSPAQAKPQAQAPLSSIDELLSMRMPDTALAVDSIPPFQQPQQQQQQQQHQLLQQQQQKQQMFFPQQLPQGWPQAAGSRASFSNGARPMSQQQPPQQQPPQQQPPQQQQGQQLGQQQGQQQQAAQSNPFDLF